MNELLRIKGILEERLDTINYVLSNHIKVKSDTHSLRGKKEGIEDVLMLINYDLHNIMRELEEEFGTKK